MRVRPHGRPSGRSARGCVRRRPRRVSGEFELAWAVAVNPQVNGPVAVGVSANPIGSVVLAPGSPSCAGPSAIPCTCPSKGSSAWPGVLTGPSAASGVCVSDLRFLQVGMVWLQGPFWVATSPCFMHKRCYASFCGCLATHDRDDLRCAPCRFLHPAPSGGHRPRGGLSIEHLFPWWGASVDP